MAVVFESSCDRVKGLRRDERACRVQSEKYSADIRRVDSRTTSLMESLKKTEMDRKKFLSHVTEVGCCLLLFSLSCHAFHFILCFSLVGRSLIISI